VTVPVTSHITTWRYKTTGESRILILRPIGLSVTRAKSNLFPNKHVYFAYLAIRGFVVYIL